MEKGNFLRKIQICFGVGQPVLLPGGLAQAAGKGGRVGVDGLHILQGQLQGQGGRDIRQGRQRVLPDKGGLELHRVAYVVTRSTTQRSEEVYDQMDLYTAAKRLFAVSLRPGSEGYEFWRNDFIQNVQRWLEQN